MVDLRPIERHFRRHLTSGLDRQRFDRAKQFVDETKRHGIDEETAHRVQARWLKFLCCRAPTLRELWPEEVGFLRHFAAVFGLPPAERREFVRLSLLGELWRSWCYNDLYQGPPELVGRLTRVTGWEHFDRCRDGAGVILLPIHAQFSRLFRPYLRYRGHDSIGVGLTYDKLEATGFRTSPAKQLELARQMHAAKHLLSRRGIAHSLPDFPQNDHNCRLIEFFGRQRRIATGFAELALKTGAHVMPIAHQFSRRGFFLLEFGAPFHVLGPHSPHDQRVDSLVGQYASFLRDEWRRYPWNIQWAHLRLYCRLPKFDPGALGEMDYAPRLSEAGFNGGREGFAR